MGCSISPVWRLGNGNVSQQRLAKGISKATACVDVISIYRLGICQAKCH